MGPPAKEPLAKTDHLSESISPVASRPSSSAGAARLTPRGAAGSPGQGKEGRARWLAQIKDWFSASEPSTQAFKQHRQETFKKAGVDMNDAQAHARLHAPIGSIPDDAIKPSVPGLEPEEVAKRRAEEKRKLAASYSGIWTGGSVSQTSSRCGRGGSVPSFTFRGRMGREE